jgi:voltage-gated potassium channel
MEVALSFVRYFWHGLAYISPIILFLLLLILTGAWLFHRVERRPWGEALYMAFITAITIGYGDMTPQRPLTRLTAILLGLVGVIFTGIIVSLAVYATSEALASASTLPPRMR